ncbi:MAG: dTDP-4-dehydrorhamnose 3,5-epimerase [Pseudolabrys sp.]|nr:dTDP-4-dehydrorhamnose 3,5-epimerase [Pseudolabrys sp.]MDP2295574.1 dTDP-4-dehydrorhamnose 3,5-epimerase [Pseudolabrys sp.]
MKIEDAGLPGLKLLTPKRIDDGRGFFSETYRRDALAEHGIDLSFVQDNHSLSLAAGVVRGLHFQSPPHAQTKLVRVVRGGILDVAVDIRRGSPTYGRHVAIELSAGNWQQLLVSVGFAHGFCTLSEQTEVIYKVTDYYSAQDDRGLLWNDPALGIAWPVTADRAVLSERDRKHPALADLVSPFDFDGGAAA